MRTQRYGTFHGPVTMYERAYKILVTLTIEVVSTYQSIIACLQIGLEAKAKGEGML